MGTHMKKNIFYIGSTRTYPFLPGKKRRNKRVTPSSFHLSADQVFRFSLFTSVFLVMPSNLAACVLFPPQAFRARRISRRSIS